MNTEHGNIKITEEAIASCVAKAVLETDGIYSLSGGITQNLFRKTSDTKGIKISKNDDKINVDIALIVEYGVKIPSVAWTLQENVKKKVKETLDIDVDYVNILVQEIHFE